MVYNPQATEKETYRHRLAFLEQQMRRVIVGYDYLVRRILYGLFSDGQKTLGRTTCAHLLLLAYPGLGKSTADLPCRRTRSPPR